MPNAVVSTPTLKRLCRVKYAKSAGSNEDRVATLSGACEMTVVQGTKIDMYVPTLTSSTEIGGGTFKIL